MSLQTQRIDSDSSHYLPISRLPQTIDEFRAFYNRFGAKATLLVYLLVRGKPLRLYDLFRFHQAIAGVSSDNSTRKVLKRLLRDGLIYRKGKLYYPSPDALLLMWDSIDWSRVRTKRYTGNGVVSKPSKRRVRGVGSQVRRVVRIARSLARRGDTLRAVSLLTHTLLGVRQTGVLLYRKGGLFIVYEHKDRSVRVLFSERIGKLFDDLGLPEGSLYMHMYYRAGRIIHNVFGGYRVARRMFYFLREHGFFYVPASEVDRVGEYRYDPHSGKLIVRIGNWTYEVDADLDAIDSYVENLNSRRTRKSKKKSSSLVSYPRERFGIVRVSKHTKVENDVYYLNYTP